MVNREIKFRAWHEASNVFFNWDDISINGRNNCIIHINEGVFEINSNINPVVIEQYTGLKDKNGKEIYENDIVKTNDDYDKYGMQAGEKNEVYFNAGGFRLKPNRNTKALGFWLEDGNDVQIIGNIHENPELLNK